VHETKNAEKNTSGWSFTIEAENEFSGINFKRMESKSLTAIKKS
jgi:hypothetical protein